MNSATTKEKYCRPSLYVNSDSDVKIEANMSESKSSPNSEMVQTVQPVSTTVLKKFIF